MLQLYIDNKLAVLDEDTSLDIEVTSPIWNPDASGAFAYEFSLDIEANRHIFGTADQIHGDSIYKAVHGKKFRLIAEGVPLYSGIVQLDSEVTIESGRVDITLASGNREWSEVLSDIGSCRNVKLLTDVPLGSAFHGIRISSDVWRCCWWWYTSDTQAESDTDEYYQGTFVNDIDLSNEALTADCYPQHYAGKSGSYIHQFDIDEHFCNTSEPYNHTTHAYPFCNIRVTWTKKSKGSDGNYVNATDPSDTTGRAIPEKDEMLIGAARTGSAPCFYVGYFLDSLFSEKNGNAVVVRNDLYDYPDFSRLAFLNTKIGWDFINTEEERNLYDVVPVETINSAFAEYVYSRRYEDVRITGRTDHQNMAYLTPYIDWWNTENSFTDDLLLKNRKKESLHEEDMRMGYSLARVIYPKKIDISAIVSPIKANADNFPDVDCSEVIDALQNAFGMRFVFDSNNNTMSVTSVDKVLRDTDIVDVPCIIHSVTKTENDVRGFRLKYSAAGDPKDLEKDKQSLLGGREITENLEFDYSNYDNVATMTYPEMRRNISMYDARCFYNEKTGNSYRIKVDKDATDETKLFPSLFQVGQYRSAEVGDCRDDDYVDEVSIGFSPMASTVLDYFAVQGSPNQDEGGDNYDNQYPVYALLVDGDIYPSEEISTEIKRSSFTSVVADTFGKSGMKRTFPAYAQFPVTVSYTYRPTYYIGCDREGINSSDPVQSFDAGFTLGLMRGPGADGGVDDNVVVNYDGEGNNVWMLRSGKYAFHSDSLDDYGTVFDYNGTGQGGQDMSTRFSLVLRPEKPNKDYDPSQPESETNTPFLPIDSTAARRGLFDKFYALYAYWVTHHKTAVIDCTVELSVLRNLNLMKHLRFGDTVGLVNKINYGISHDGMTDIKVELFYL